MPTIGRLKNGDLMTIGEVNERLPVVVSGLIAHYPMDTIPNRYYPTNIRYIRDYLQGSTANAYNHWVQIKAFDITGANVAQGKAATIDGGNVYKITDGNTASTSYDSGPSPGVLSVAMVDLGALYSISTVTVWHYYADGRTYHNTKTEVSDDGVNWFPIFDSAIEGEYVETGTGKVTSLFFPTGTTIVPATSDNIDFSMEGDGVYTGDKLGATSVVNMKASSPATLGSDEVGKYFIKADNTTWTAGITYGPVPVAAGQKYTFMIEVMCDTPFTGYWDANTTASNYSGNDAVRFGTTVNSFEYDTPGKWKRLYITNEVRPDAVMPMASDNFCPADSRIFGKKVYYRNSFLRVEPYPSALLPRTRAGAAMLSYPIKPSNPSTISLEYYYDNIKSPYDNCLFSFDNGDDTNNTFALYLTRFDKWRVVSGTSNVNYTELIVNNTLTEGWHTFTVTITTAKLALNIDGVEVGSVANPKIFGTVNNFRVGCSGNKVNLVKNGYGELSNNSNLSLLTYITSDSANGDGKAFSRTSTSDTIVSDELIPIDPTKTYEINVWVKTDTNADSFKQYLGIACYDKTNSLIDIAHCSPATNTFTTLAQQLKPGDTTVYLTSVANWTVGTQGTYIHQKQIAFWNTGDYPNYTYTRTLGKYLNVDATAKTITLDVPWAGVTIPAGTAVANTHDGSGYTYCVSSNSIVPTTWTKYTATIGGGQYVNPDDTQFRYGTRFIRFMCLSNRGSAGPYTTKFDNIEIREVANSSSNSLIKNVSVYNRVLSATEILALGVGKFSIESDGRFFSTVVEGPIRPYDTIYFPLGQDSKAIASPVAAASEVGLLYKDGAAWIGTSLTNYVTTSMVPQNWQTTPIKANETLFDGSQVWQMTGVAAGGGWRYGCTNGTLELAPNKYATTSIWLKKGTANNMPAHYMQGYYYDTATSSWIHNDPISGKLTVTSEYWMDVYGTIYTSNPMNVAGNENNWYWHVRTFYNNYTQNIRLSSNWYYLSSTHTSGTCYFACPQLEAKQFASPFVVGTRASGKLEFNLNRDYGLNWSGDWTICYWKKTIGAQSDLLTGYSIDSLGCNSNTVGGGYVWWGKESGTDTFNASGWTNTLPTTLPPASYFNKWVFISITKTGTAIKLNAYLEDGTQFAETGTLSTAAANYYVNQYGYDLKLGGWDSVNGGNAYFQDLIVAKRALTDAELTTIRNLFLKNEKGVLRFPGSLKEVSSLDQ